MIKLIATDLDGTLFYPKRKLKLLTKKNRKFMKDFVNDGNEIALVSGRNYFVSKRIEKRIKNKIDMIGCNGSVVYHSGELLFDSPMNHQDVYDFYLKNRNNKNILTWIFMSDKNNMIVVHNSLSTLLRVIYRIVLFFQFGYNGKYKIGRKKFEKMVNDDNAKIYKIMAIYGLGKKATEKARLASLEVSKETEGKFEVMWSKESIELMNSGVNKAKSLEKLIDNIGIKKEEVAVIGDSGNDVPLFETFPNSFVMSHAHQEVKKKAKVEIDGVYCLKDYIK